MKTQVKIMAAIAFSTVSISSMAAPQGQRLQQAFEKVDSDHNGKLTQQEAEKGMPRLAKNFAQIDADKSGDITLDEVKKSVSSHRG